MLALPGPRAVTPYTPAAGAMVAYPSTPPPVVRSTLGYTPPHHNVAHHEYHNDQDYPVSPYPELKDLVGPLHRPHGHHHHHRRHGHHHGPTSPRQAHVPVLPTNVHFTGYHPRTYQDYERMHDGLPNFPDNYWIEEPHDHRHRASYEQLLYAAYEHAHRLDFERQARQGDALGGYHQGSDMEAMNAALAGPHGWMMHGDGSPQALAEPIKILVERKMAEAERIRRIANRVLSERGREDPGSMEAQEALLQAEAEAHGAVAVERSLESAAQGQAMQQIAITVQHFEEEKRDAEVAWHDAQGRFGNNSEKTHAARTTMLQAAAAWQGALAAQSAPAERGFEAAEHPQAIANRANDAAEAFREEAAELSRKAELLSRKYGKTDKRAIDAQQAADEATKKADAALFEAETAQAVADGKEPPLRPGLKKKKKRTRGGCC